jgi:hypothetical protein
MKNERGKESMNKKRESVYDRIGDVDGRSFFASEEVAFEFDGNGFKLCGENC